jgi:hypothetical protein
MNKAQTTLNSLGKSGELLLFPAEVLLLGFFREHFRVQPKLLICKHLLNTLAE